VTDTTHRRITMPLLLKNVLYTLIIPATAAVYLPLLIAQDVRFPDWGVAQFAALVPLALGAAGYFRCLWEFGKAGRGTPAPIDPPQRLVVTGLYRYVRNPMYLGVLLIVAGWALFFQYSELVKYWLITALVLHGLVRIAEEPLLRRKFGDAYLEYCRSVNRWVPRLTPVRDLIAP
jgi:protein-S-isoprenylcysteine O-methyltransferase Ste14